MRYSKLLLAVIGMLGMHMAGAVPTPEEAAQLGITGTPLTPFGAIRAGNKEGTIPEWTGGLCKPPANYKPHFGLEIGGGPFPDPYAADKPLFKITAENLAQYADKVDETNKELLRRFPKTYYMNVYPSHRSFCAANWIYENTIKRAMNPRITGGAIPSLTGAWAQSPFPIPKTGVEEMWNSNMQVERVWTNSEYFTWYVDAVGNRSLIAAAEIIRFFRYWTNTPLAETEPYLVVRSETQYPAAKVGGGNLLHYNMRHDLKGDPVWSYFPGQRRVRLAPEFAYDGVSPEGGGTMLYDEGAGFMGKMDRFDFKLMGRKEMYISYNNSEERMNTREEVAMPNHPDPAAIRWELHRVWNVVATLKPGFRHVQSKKIFYMDEDSHVLAVYIGFDQAGKPHHSNVSYLMQAYDRPAMSYTGNSVFDFSRGSYTYWMYTGKAAGIAYYGEIQHKPRSMSYFTPEGLAGSGVR